MVLANPRPNLRRASSLLLAGLALVAGWAVGARGTSLQPADSHTGRLRITLTGTPNYACTPGRGFSSLVERVGPFCLPPDAIPAIDHPRFAPAASVHSIAPDEPVLVVRLHGEARAYPLRVLVWHEIVNDTLDGVPVAVTFCPLCDTGVSFVRRAAGRVLTFGVSGRLIGANLVMFDRETETLWQQVTGEAVSGRLAGASLRMIATQTLSLREFRQSAPDGLVMTQRTGIYSYYGADPYAGYAKHPGRPSSFQFGTPADPRLPPKRRVLGVTDGPAAVAVVYPRRPGAPRVLDIRLDGEDVVVLMRYGVGLPSTRAIYAHEVAGWSGAAFLPEIGRRIVDLTPTRTGFVDRGTGSVFDLSGRAVSGPLAGRALRPLSSTDAFWFAWAHFHPRTLVVRPA